MPNSHFILQAKHDTAANLAAANKIPAEAELVLESDTNKFKFGDGETRWNDLPYAGGGAVSRLYGQYGFNGLQTNNFAVGQRVLLNTKLSGTLPNPVNGVVTLPAGKTFKLQFMISVDYTSNTAASVFRFYNITDQVAFGSQAQSASLTYPTNPESMNPTAVGFITTTKDTEIEMRITFNTGLANIYGDYTTLVIEEM